MVWHRRRRSRHTGLGSVRTGSATLSSAQEHPFVAGLLSTLRAGDFHKGALKSLTWWIRNKAGPALRSAHEQLPLAAGRVLGGHGIRLRRARRSRWLVVQGASKPGLLKRRGPRREDANGSPADEPSSEKHLTHTKPGAGPGRRRGGERGQSCQSLEPLRSIERGS
jgi:hypothetical protein